MEITWLGHSSIKIQSGDATLVTDPYDNSIGMSMSRTSAEIVTVSHDHPNHSSVNKVSGSPRVLTGPGEYEIGSFYIRGLGTRRSTSDDGPRQVNTIYSIRAEGLSVCHLGDLNESLPPRISDELSKTDILIVPAGGVCTLGVDRAVALVNLIGPRMVIPVHYGSDDSRVELGPLNAFLDEIGATEASPVNRLTITTTNLPRELRVVVFNRN